MDKYKSWLIPLVISAGLFLLIRPVFAQIVEGNTDLSQFLSTGSVEAGEEAVDGFTQIYYLFRGDKVFITQGSFTSRQPDSNGEYIAYVKDMNGAGQIFLYNIPLQSTIQITNSGTNLNPRVSKGRVVWEKWVEDRWQIFLFDGRSVSQVSDGDVSVNPEIDGDFVTFSRQDLSGTFRAVVYSIKSREAKDIITGQSAKKTKIEGRKIILEGSGTEEGFPLTIDDLFLLDLVPLAATASPAPEPVAPETVGVEEIIEELEVETQPEESTSSGELE